MLGVSETGLRRTGHTKQSMLPEVKIPDYFPGMSCRLVLAIMIFLGFFVNYMLRINISLVIVAMVKSRGGEFDWDKYSEGLVLGAFFCGYVCTQVPGGRLAEIYGTKRIYGYNMLAVAVLAVLTPLAARTHLVALLAVRLLQGLCEGVTFPSVYPMTTKWIPEQERSTFIGFSYYGGTFGTVVTLPFCAVVLDSLGWEAVFYISGLLGIIWFFFWEILVFDSPAEHPRIQNNEREYINNHLKESNTYKPTVVPWWAMLTSVPVWAIVVANVGSSWGMNTLLTEGPLYMRNVLDFDIKQNGFYSGLPYLCRFLFGFLYGCLVDTLKTRNILELKTIRRLSNILSHGLPGIIMALIPSTGSSAVAFVALISLALGLNGAGGSGDASNVMDIAPNFSGTLYGISNGIGSCTGFIIPLVTAGLIQENESQESWSSIFLLASAMYISSSIVFLLFSQVEVQPWNNIFHTEEKVLHDRIMNTYSNMSYTTLHKGH